MCVKLLYNVCKAAQWTTLCKTTHCVWDHTSCVKSHTVYKITHNMMKIWCFRYGFIHEITLPTHLVRGFHPPVSEKKKQKLSGQQNLDKACELRLCALVDYPDSLWIVWTVCGLSWQFVQTVCGLSRQFVDCPDSLWIVQTVFGQLFGFSGQFLIYLDNFQPLLG